MKYMLQHSQLENAYFQNIMARIAKNFSASSDLAGMESLNESVVKFLGVNYDNYRQINQAVQNSTVIDSETKGLFAGIESVVTEGVGVFLNNHGYLVDLPDGVQSSEAYRVAVEAIKDEFEGTDDSSNPADDTGDTNSAVIQAIIDDLKNRQASDVGKTVNLILKLNADKQQEMLQEEKENTDEINEAMDETGLDGDGSGDDDMNDDLAEDSENPLDAKADEADEEGKSDDLAGDDTGDLPPDESLQDNKKGSKGKGKEKPSKEDSGDSFGDNPFGGFESYEERYALNGTNGYEAGLEFFDANISGVKVGGSGISLLEEFSKRLVFQNTEQGLGMAYAMLTGYAPLDMDVFNKAARAVLKDMFMFNLPRFLISTTIIKFTGIMARRAAEMRPFEKSIATHHTFGKVYKGKIYMQPKQFEKAESAVAEATKGVASNLISKLNNHPVMKELNKSRSKDQALVLGKMFKEPLTQGEYTCFGYISPLLFAGLDPKGRKKKEMAAYVKDLTNTVFGEANTKITEELTKVNAKYKGFEITLVTPKDKELKGFLLIGYKSNVVVSQVFTESEVRDFMEGVFEGLNEYDPVEANAFMNGLEHEENTLELDGFNEEDEFGEGTEAFDLSTTLKISGLYSVPLSFIMEKIARYKAGENIFRKSIKMESTVYNEHIKAMETAISSQTKYIEGIIRGINKTASWLAEVGAIKVIKKPEFVDGICVIVAYDAVHPISINKKDKTLNYRNQSIPLADLGISRFTALNPFKGLGSVLVTISKELNFRLNQIVKQHMDKNPLFGGVNPLKIPNGEAGWGIVAYRHYEPKVKAGTESLDDFFGSIEEEENLTVGVEDVDFTTEIPDHIEAFFYEEGTEGVINSIKSKYRSISLLKSTLEMSTQEYNSFANEFKTYGKEALDSLLIDIKNDPELGLLGLGRYLTTPNHTVSMDKKNRPQVLIYSAGTGLIPASYWKQFEDKDGAVSIKAQNAKYDKLVKIIKKSLETFINTTKFKGMTVFPKISANFSTVYAVIANPIKITANAQPATESHVFEVITGEYNNLPVFGTESENGSMEYMNNDYKLYNKLLGYSSIGAKIKAELTSLLSFDEALESAYNRIGECVEYGDIKSMKVDRPNSVRFTLAKLDLSNTKASVLFRNTMLDKLFTAAETVVKTVANNMAYPIIMNGENNSIDMIIPAVSDKLTVGTESADILLTLCDNYTRLDYNKDKKLDELAEAYGYQALGVESVSTSNDHIYNFDTMVNVYRKLTKGGLDKRRAEYYTNSLFGIDSKSVAELSNYLGGIETEDIQVMKERASVLNNRYMSKLVGNIAKYSPISTYEETKRLIQESLDIVGEGNVKYYKDHGLIIGFESGDIIGLAKGMASRAKHIPSYAYADIVQFANSIPQNVCIIPINLGLESTDNLNIILKTYKEVLSEIEMTSNIKSLADIRFKSLLGNVMYPFEGMESSLETHILKLNENARLDKLQEAYDMYGVESVEYKHVLDQHRTLTLASYDAYTSVILTASLFGLRYNKSGIYTINEF